MIEIMSGDQLDALIVSGITSPSNGVVAYSLTDDQTPLWTNTASFPNVVEKTVISPDGSKVAATDSVGGVFVLDASNGQELWANALSSTGDRNAISFSNDSSKIFVGYARFTGNQLLSFNSSTGGLVFSESPGGLATTSEKVLCVSPQGDVFYSASNTNSSISGVFIVDQSTGATIDRIFNLDNPDVTGLTRSPSGDIIATTSSNQNLIAIIDSSDYTFTTVSKDSPIPISSSVFEHRSGLYLQSDGSSFTTCDESFSNVMPLSVNGRASLSLNQWIALVATEDNLTVRRSDLLQNPLFNASGSFTGSPSIYYYS